ncbi:MAG: cobaltochelatase subunit CobN [Methylococcaceae bacterium]
MHRQRYLAAFKPLAFLALVTLWLTLSISPGIALAQQAPAAKPILFLAAAPTQPGKFEHLKAIAVREGMQIEARFLDKFTGQEKTGDFDRFGLIVIDAPYGPAQGVAKERLGPLLPQIKTPWLWMQNDAPDAKGMGATLMKTLHSYYSNGGRANFAEFFCQVNAQVFKQATRACLPPQIFPDTGIYHPDYTGRVFSTLEDYLAWKSPQTPTLSQKEKEQSGKPVVAILFHQAHFASELTGFLDDTIRRLEAAGAVALPIYAPIMTNGAITRLLTFPSSSGKEAGGKAFADVLINNQIMLNAEGRRSEFEALGIPVIQAMPFRRGEQADWEKDNAGVSTLDIPFYLAQPEYTGITDPIIAAYSRKADGDIVAGGIMAFKAMLPLQQLCVGGEQGRVFEDGSSRNEAVGGIFVQSFQSNRKYADFTVNGILNQTGGKKFVAPSAGRLRKHQTTCTVKHFAFPETDSAHRQLPGLPCRLRDVARSFAQSRIVLIHPHQCVSIKQDHELASHSTSIGDMMSPLISTMPLCRPNGDGRVSSTYGRSSATGLPFLVISIASPVRSTSSISARQFALNSDAWIVCIIVSPVYDCHHSNQLHAVKQRIYPSKNFKPLKESL